MWLKKKIDIFYMDKDWSYEIYDAIVNQYKDDIQECYRDNNSKIILKGGTEIGFYKINFYSHGQRADEIYFQAGAPVDWVDFYAIPCAALGGNHAVCLAAENYDDIQYGFGTPARTYILQKAYPNRWKEKHLWNVVSEIINEGNSLDKKE